MFGLNTWTSAVQRSVSHWNQQSAHRTEVNMIYDFPEKDDRFPLAMFQSPRIKKKYWHIM